MLRADSDPMPKSRRFYQGASWNSSLECKSQYVPKNASNILRHSLKRKRTEWAVQHYPGCVPGTVEESRGGAPMK